MTIWEKLIADLKKESFNLAICSEPEFDKFVMTQTEFNKAK